jgi:hypothetical protein
MHFKQSSMSPELETLDQLLGGNLTLAVVRTFYSDEHAFARGVLGLVSCGDVRLLTTKGVEVPTYQWRELFIGGAVTGRVDELQLEITDQGAQKVV